MYSLFEVLQAVIAKKFFAASFIKTYLYYFATALGVAER